MKDKLTTRIEKVDRSMLRFVLMRLEEARQLMTINRQDEVLDDACNNHRVATTRSL